LDNERTQITPDSIQSDGFKIQFDSVFSIDSLPSSFKKSDFYYFLLSQGP
jgi:hypothetical protein